MRGHGEQESHCSGSDWPQTSPSVSCLQLQQARSHLPIYQTSQHLNGVMYALESLESLEPRVRRPCSPPQNSGSRTTATSPTETTRTRGLLTTVTMPSLAGHPGRRMLVSWLA